MTALRRHTDSSSALLTADRDDAATVVDRDPFESAGGVLHGAFPGGKTLDVEGVTGSHVPVLLPASPSARHVTPTSHLL